MPWKETLYERPIKRPIDAQAREVIQAALAARRGEIPTPTEIVWHSHKPELVIRSKWISFIVRFTQETMVVDAELTLAAKMMATEANRRQAVQFIESVAQDLDL